MVNFWQNGEGLGVRIVCGKIVNRGNGVGRQTTIERIKYRKPLSAQWEMKKEWERELYVRCFCYINERSAIAWFGL
jgi:hypothetical protein